MKYSWKTLFTIAILLLAALFLYQTFNGSKTIELEKKISVETESPQVVIETPPVEVEIIETFDNKFTSDVRDVNNTNYESYVFGGKISK